MSLFRKLVILFGLSFLIVLTATLSIVYSESRSTIVELSKKRAVSIIQTIDSALESNIPDYQFEEVLLHLKRQDPDIISFDIYKLNAFLYDIASTNTRKIGTQANQSSIVNLTKHTPMTTLHGTVMEITAPIEGYKGVVYSANVKFSIADDLKSTQVLLAEVLLIGLCALALAVFAVWMFTREFLSKPVLAVVSAANDVAMGNLQVDLQQSQARSDEIGSLARSFQRMTASLQQLMGRMAETAEELNRDFQELVTNGDFTARGALHLSDLIHHVSQSVEAQAAHLSQLSDKLEHAAAKGAVQGHGDVADDTRDWLRSIRMAVQQAEEITQHLQGASHTANGQLGAVQKVNQTAAQLSQMANELRKLISTYEI